MQFDLFELIFMLLHLPFAAAALWLGNWHRNMPPARQLLDDYAQHPKSRTFMTSFWMGFWMPMQRKMTRQFVQSERGNNMVTGFYRLFGYFLILVGVLIIVSMLWLSFLLFSGHPYFPTRATVEDYAGLDYCTEDTDCINVGGSCETGCIMLINQAERDTVDPLLSQPWSGCHIDCPPYDDPYCDNGVCQINERQ